MTSIEEILAECKSSGIILLPDGDGLAIDAPRETLTAKVLDRLKEHKQALLEFMQPPKPESTNATDRDFPDPFADQPVDRPQDERVRHKRDGCTATTSWRHAFGGRYCETCWPCTDKAMRVVETAAGSMAGEGVE